MNASIRPNPAQNTVHQIDRRMTTARALARRQVHELVISDFAERFPEQIEHAVLVLENIHVAAGLPRERGSACMPGDAGGG